VSDLPTVVTAAGLQPQAPAALRAQLVAAVAATNPGYTADLPASLVEDVVSTDVGAVTLMDQARVALVNSLTPYGANVFLLLQLGNIYGVPMGVGSNTQVSVVFSGSPGFIVGRGFLVSDGNFQYACQEGTTIGAGGISTPVTAIATQQGSWAVPFGTVTNLVTSIPNGVILTVNNPLPGLPGLGAQTPSDYRAQVLQAGLAASTGMSRYLKTLLGNVPGVQPRLVSARAQTGGGWEIIVGGGDQYAVAEAIYESVFDVSTLVGSVMSITNITNANPAVVTTLLNHGLATGTVAQINGVVGMTQINGPAFTVTVIDEKDFSIGVNSSGYSAYISGGVVTPNPRNVVVTITDYPDVYQVPIVLPPQQAVVIDVTWNTIATNPVSAAAVSQLAAPALIAYVNAVAVGQPLVLYELESIFQAAVASVLPPQLLTRMIFAVSINGVGTAPISGTGIIAGDPESYFYAGPTAVIVTQG